MDAQPTEPHWSGLFIFLFYVFVSLTFCKSMESCWMKAWSSCSFCSRAVILFSAPVFKAVTRSLHWKKADNEQIWISHLIHTLLQEKYSGSLDVRAANIHHVKIISGEDSLALSEAEAQREKFHPGLSKKSWSAFGVSIETKIYWIAQHGWRSSELREVKGNESLGVGVLSPRQRRASPEPVPELRSESVAKSNGE